MKEIDELRERVAALEGEAQDKNAKSFRVSLAAAALAVLSLLASIVSLMQAEEHRLRLLRSEFRSIVTELEVIREAWQTHVASTPAPMADVARSLANRRAVFLGSGDMIADEIADQLAPANLGVLGASHQDAGNLQKAASYYRMATRASLPMARSAAHRSLAVLLYMDGRQTEARRHFEEAISAWTGRSDPPAIDTRCFILNNWLELEALGADHETTKHLRERLSRCAGEAKAQAPNHRTGGQQ